MAEAKSKEGASSVTKTRPKILLCLSGSVAALKAPQLTVLLSQFAEVRQLQLGCIKSGARAHTTDCTLPVAGQLDVAYNRVVNVLCTATFEEWCTSCKERGLLPWGKLEVRQ